MRQEPSPSHTREPTPGDLVPFFALVFAVPWIVLGFASLAPVGEIDGRHPLFVLAVYAPALVALGLVVARSGRGGLRRFLARLAWWRAPAAVWAFVVVGPPVLYAASAALAGGTVMPPAVGGLAPSLIALVVTLLIGPVEEIGWRGFALPLLQRRLAPLWAGVWLGLAWGLWHLPAFAVAGTPQSDWPFWPFLAGVVANSVIMTALFNAARGSLLVPALYHFQLNNPLWPEADDFGWALFAVVAAVIAVWNPGGALRRCRAVTAVVPMPRR